MRFDLNYQYFSGPLNCKIRKNTAVKKHLWSLVLLNYSRFITVTFRDTAHNYMNMGSRLLSREYSKVEEAAGMRRAFRTFMSANRSLLLKERAFNRHRKSCNVSAHKCKLDRKRISLLTLINLLWLYGYRKRL